MFIWRRTHSVSYNASVPGMRGVELGGICFFLLLLLNLCTSDNDGLRCSESDDAVDTGLLLCWCVPYLGEAVLHYSLAVG